MATLISRLTDFAAAVRDKINAMMPRLQPQGGTAGQALLKTSANDYASVWQFFSFSDLLNKPTTLAGYGVSKVIPGTSTFSGGDGSLYKTLPDGLVIAAGIGSNRDLTILSRTGGLVFSVDPESDTVRIADYMLVLDPANAEAYASGTWEFSGFVSASYLHFPGYGTISAPSTAGINLLEAPNLLAQKNILGILDLETAVVAKFDDTDSVITKSGYVSMVAGGAGAAPVFDGTINTITSPGGAARDSWWSSSSAKSGDFVASFERTGSTNDDSYLWFSTSPATKVNQPADGIPIMELYYNLLYYWDGVAWDISPTTNIYGGARAKKLFFKRKGTELEIWSGDNIETAVYRRSVTVPAGALYLNYGNGFAGYNASAKISFYDIVVPSLVEAIRVPDKAIGLSLEDKLDTTTPIGRGSFYLNGYDISTGLTNTAYMQIFQVSSVLPFHMQFKHPANNYRWDVGKVNATAWRVQFNTPVGYTGFEFDKVPYVVNDKMLHAGMIGTGLSFNGTTLTTASVVPINAQPGTTYTLALTDVFVTMNNTSANTLTVPPNSSVAFPIGTVITVVQVGAGSTTIVAGSGVTINKPDTLVLRKQHSAVTLTKIGTNTWQLIGDTQ